MLLRAQLSAALVVRGDDLLYRSEEARALSFYRRALVLDPDNAAAADRYVFLEMLRRRRIGLRAGVRVASAFIDRHRQNAVLLMDRALCERLLSQNRAAEEDFLRAGHLKRDSRALVFAGYEALRLGRRAQARAFWREALAFRRNYPPALRALRLR